VSVVARDTRRRWLLVGTGVLALCLLPAAVGAVAAKRTSDPADPVRLRQQVLASTARPYQGYVDVQARLDLPDLPELGEVAGLFGGTTRLRAWYASADAWRVAVLSPTGERDIYRTLQGTYQWDFERNLVTEVLGDLPVRLPWAADLVPPYLARRLLSMAADEPVAAIGSRRVAGVTAYGLRLASADPDTTVGRVDVWADPTTGLPLEVEVAARGSDTPLIRTRFLDVSSSRPSARVLAAPRPVSAGFTTTSEPDVLSAINRSVAAVALPVNLAGRARMSPPSSLSTLGGAAAYGTGLSRFFVLALPRPYGQRTLRAAEDHGGVPVELDGGHGFELSAPLLSTLVVHRDGGWPGPRTFLLAGTVSPAVLRQAGGDLLRAGAGPG
jgi:hypothetical protein